LTNKADIFIQENRARIIDKWRPKFHLAGEYGWINDPNGFIQYKDLYHQFYQHHPYEPIWGPMHWGHATSEDMIKWKYCDIALTPDNTYDLNGCFSGSAIEYNDNLYLMYTGHVTNTNNCRGYSQTQCLASSVDGFKFIKHPMNPVIDTHEIPDGFSPSDFRDPRVFRRNGVFYALIGSQTDNGIGHMLLFKSCDLLNWKYINTIYKNDGTIGKNAWECPDIVAFDEQDVLIFSVQNMASRGYDFHNLHSSVYTVGKLDLENGIFDGSQLIPLDCGFDFYAPQVLADKRGRRIMTAWMGMWESDSPTASLGHNWAGSMILPRELSLTDGRLVFNPVQEIINYRSNSFYLENLELKSDYILNTESDCYELEAVFQNIGSKSFGLNLRVGAKEKTSLRFFPDKELFEIDRNNSGKGPGGIRQTKLTSEDGLYRLRAFVDRSSIEVFVNNGEKVLSARIYPKDESKGIMVCCESAIKLLSLRKWDLMRVDCL